MESDELGDEEQHEQATELVMKKHGNVLHVWAIGDGEEVFHAAPTVTRSKGAVTAAVQTFLSRAWQQEFDELEQEAGDKGWLDGIR